MFITQMRTWGPELSFGAYILVVVNGRGTQKNSGARRMREELLVSEGENRVDADGLARGDVAGG
jgi:hypothetical protein